MKKLLIFFGILICLGSCDDGFVELNVDPNNPTEVPSSLLLGDIIRVTNNLNYWSFTGGDMGSCWGQHWSKVQYNDEERYIVRTGIIQSYWEDMYASVISDAKAMEDLALAEENSAGQGVAIIMQAYGFHMLTDIYGDIPFTDAIKGGEGNTTPSYDTQEVVYEGILAMLDDAVTKLQAGGTITASSDLIYGGDTDKWQKFANSLKFRCLMRISAAKDVASELQALVSAGNMFSSNDDEAKLPYLESDPNANPTYETVVYGGRAEYKVSSVLVELLETLNDPRLPVYAQTNSDGEYRGKIPGYTELPSKDYNYDNVSAIGEKYLEATLPGYMVSYTELLFLHAEAAQKGYISGSASDYYLKAIENSFLENEISDQYAAYINQAPVVLSADNASALKQIGEQKWLGLYGQGLETWIEWKRTKYPVLTPAIDGYISTIPLRFTYPSIEQSVNASAYSEAVNRLDGGDKLSSSMWWIK